MPDSARALEREGGVSSTTFDAADNASLPGAPLNIAAEVQLIYKPYLEQGRRQSHLPYKVVRCETVGELARDAGGKRQSDEAREAVRKAEAACMGIVRAEL